jgi:hypothetical protein
MVFNYLTHFMSKANKVALAAEALKLDAKASDLI